MNTRYTPSYTPKTAEYTSTKAERYGHNLLNLLFIIGWWVYFSEIGHALTMIVTKGCYCDFSLPTVPCYGVYTVIGEILLLLVISVPLFVRFYRGFFVEQVGAGKKILILLCSVGIFFLIPYALWAVESIFSNLMPDISTIEFTSWADADIVRFVRNSYPQ